MGTAPKKSRAARQLARSARDVRVRESMEFFIFEDNGGAYHWRIVDADGATLAESGTFASYDRAEQAAQRVRDGAASARFIRRRGVLGAVDRGTRRDRPREDLNAERRLDQGGSFAREAVERWPDQR
jgi:uncharacterized protein YegP (UPF0339 family)